MTFCRVNKMLKNHKNCQNNKQNIVKKYAFSSLLMGVTILVGCQSSPNSTVTTKSSIATTERPLVVKRVSDGVQDIQWDIIQIEGKKAQFFHNTPYLMLNSQFQQIQGNTGCNSIGGNYVIDTVKHRLDLNARSGYFSCDSALAREAELSDALQAITQFQINGKTMSLLNSRGQMLIQLQRK